MARLLKLRGQAMQAAVLVGVGAMAALLGADIEKAQGLADAVAQGEVCTVVDDDPSRVVISWTPRRDRTRNRLGEGSWHQAGHPPAGFRTFIARRCNRRQMPWLRRSLMPLQAPLVPVYANVTAAPVADGERSRLCWWSK